MNQTSLLPDDPEALAAFDPQGSTPNLPPPAPPAAAPQPMIGPPEAPSPLYQGLQIGGGLALPGQAAPAPVIRPQPGDVVIPASPGSALSQRIQAVGEQGVAPAAAPSGRGAPAAPLYRPPPMQGSPSQGAPLLTIPKAPGSAGAGAPGPDLIARDYAEQEKLLLEQANNRADAELGIAGLKENRAALRQGFADVNRLRQDKELSEERGQIDDIQALNDNAAKFRVDPTRWVANQNVFQKVALTLAAGLKGFSMGINKEGGENPVLSQINRSIDRDIQLQVQDGERLRQKGQDAQNIYSLNLAATRNHEAAIAATQSQMLDIAADHIDAQTSAINSQSVRDQGALAAQQVRMQADEYRLKAQMAAAGASAAQWKELQKRIHDDTQDNLKNKGFASPLEAQQAAIANATGQPMSATPFAGPKANDKLAAQQEAKDDALNRVSGTPLQSTYHDPRTALPGVFTQTALDENAERARRADMVQAALMSGRLGTRPSAVEALIDKQYPTMGVPPAVAQDSIRRFRQAFGGKVAATANLGNDLEAEGSR